MRRVSGYILKASGRVVGLICLIAALGLVVVLAIKLKSHSALRIAYSIVGSLFVVAMWLAYKVNSFGQRLMIREAAEVRESDPRPPILLLRSFSDDHATVFNSGRTYGTSGS
jgi:hypothetical protein